MFDFPVVNFCLNNNLWLRIVLFQCFNSLASLQVVPFELFFFDKEELLIAWLRNIKKQNNNLTTLNIP